MACAVLTVSTLSGRQRLDIVRETPTVDNLFGETAQYSAVGEGNRIILAYNANLQRIRFSVVRASDAKMAVDVPAVKKMGWLQQLLTSFFADHPREDRYSFAINGYTEMSTRIADAAIASKDWDPRTGSSIRQGDDFVLNFLKQSDAAYRELEEAFQAFGYLVTVDSIENRIVMRYAALSAHEKNLMKAKPKAGDRVPLGASVYFIVMRTK
jgi:hypothetical protein